LGDFITEDTEMKLLLGKVAPKEVVVFSNSLLL
jgi:hypothetical protein